MRIGKVSIGPRRVAALLALGTLALTPVMLPLGVDAWLIVTVALGLVILSVAAAAIADLRQLRQMIAAGQRPRNGILRQLAKMQRAAATRTARKLRRRLGRRLARPQERDSVLGRAVRYFRAKDPAAVASRQMEKDVRSLSRALWTGFSTDAVAELERIRRVGDEPAPAARAAEVLGRWYATSGKHELALDRLVHARDIDRTRDMRRIQILEHHLLTQLELFDEAEHHFEKWGAQSPDLHLAQANLRLRQAEAGHWSRDDADRQRLELIDWVFLRRSLTPISQLIGDAAPLELASFQGSVGPFTAPTGRSPVASIVVPAHNAESTLAIAVNSLRAQSLRNLEIIIVDDASDDNTNAVAKALASDDPRIRVIQHEHNQGAYGARNTGLTNASGEYFTVHDADDWSHPQLLERQLQTLQEQHATASFSRLARITPQFEFLLRPYRPMLEPIHWNYTSMIVRTQILRDLGGWDTVRAHADSELIDRMRDSFGKGALVETEPEVPLSFFSVTGANLTENKDTSLRSVDFGARKEYTDQARFWRRGAFDNGQLPSYADHRRADAKTPFFCARSLAPNRDRISQSFDLVIGSDLSLLGGTRRCNLAYIECARRLGLRVGIFSMPRYRARVSIDAAYRELLQLPDVDLVTPDAHVSARALLVHHPPVLGNVFDGYPDINAERQYLLVNQLPWQMKDYQEVQYDADVVHRHYVESFGQDPAWISISRRVRSYLAGHLPSGGTLLDEDWYPIIGKAPSTPRIRAERTKTKPVVGRHSRDHATKWPESFDALKMSYLVDSDHEVQLLGGTRAAEQVLGYRPKNWLVHPFDSVSVDDFLRGIDIFVHFHHSMYIEEFGRNVAEAMAMGVPCVLPTEYQETFTDAAVYAEPEQVAEAIRELWSDHDMYHDYSKRGIAFAAEYCGWEAGTRRIGSLLER